MKKFEELSNPTSCLSRAGDNELLFVLLERDHAAVSTIRFWADERVRLGKNEAGDPQVTEALGLADQIERKQFEAWRQQRAEKRNP